MVEAPAPLERSAGSRHFSTLVVPLLVEDREQDDHAIRSLPVGDPPRTATHREAELEETSVSSSTAMLLMF